MNLYLVIPCYNEENRLDFTKFKRLLILNQDVTFLFVDDGSSDKTKNQIERLIKGHVNAKVISSDKNLGKANAIRHGFKYIETSLNQLIPMSSFFIWTDADNQILFEDIQSMINVCRETSREYQNIIYFATRNNVKSHEIFRHFGSKLISRILRSNNKIKMPTDSQCGLKAFQISEVFAKTMTNRFETRWFIEWELLMRYYSGETLPIIIERPLSRVSRSINSHISFKNYFSILKEVLYIRKKAKHL